MIRYNVKGTGPVRKHFVGKWIKGYGSFMKFLHNFNTLDHSSIAKKRLEVLSFFEKHGVLATVDAFKVSRSTIYSWKRALKLSKHDLSSLIPKSTRPSTVRQMAVDEEVLSFIRNLRENNYRLGKVKIKILLDAYCDEHPVKIKKISVSQVGKIIKRHNLSYPETRAYHASIHGRIPGASKALLKAKKRVRVTKGSRSTFPGEQLQIDSVARFDFGTKRYIITAIDLFSRFSFAMAYKSLSSRTSLDFFQKLVKVTPYKISSVKTDNGLEFLGEFDLYLTERKITHFFSYPRTPKSNSFIERFNRTLQEEFVEENSDTLKQTTIFNHKLIDYLLYYNQVRPHQSLSYQTPLGFLVSSSVLSRMSVSNTKT